LVKFWQIGAPSTDLVTSDPNSSPPTLAAVKSITLQVEDSVVISSDSAGVVRTWDISTGLCKASFQTLAEGKRDVQLINGRLVIVWYKYKGRDDHKTIRDQEKVEAGKIYISH
jgi:hypothetical protein